MEFLSVIPMQFLHGLVYGMLLFLVASGLTLIFGMMGVLNFAHGALFWRGHPARHQDHQTRISASGILFF